MLDEVTKGVGVECEGHVCVCGAVAGDAGASADDGADVDLVEVEGEEGVKGEAGEICGGRGCKDGGDELVEAFGVEMWIMGGGEEMFAGGKAGLLEKVGTRGEVYEGETMGGGEGDCGDGAAGFGDVAALGSECGGLVEEEGVGCGGGGEGGGEEGGEVVCEGWAVCVDRGGELERIGEMGIEGGEGGRRGEGEGVGEGGSGGRGWREGG